MEICAYNSDGTYYKEFKSNKTPDEIVNGLGDIAEDVVVAGGKTYPMNYVTLDWDCNHSYNIKNRESLLKEWIKELPIESTKTRISANGGTHVLIKYPCELEFLEWLEIKSILADDFQRIRMDLQRHAGWIEYGKNNRLWDWKYKELTGLSYTSKWKVFK